MTDPIRSRPPILADILSHLARWRRVLRAVMAASILVSVVVAWGAWWLASGEVALRIGLLLLLASCLIVCVWGWLQHLRASREIARVVQQLADARSRPPVLAPGRTTAHSSKNALAGSWGGEAEPRG